MLSKDPKNNLLLQSFGDTINVAVIGANGGIGQALVEQLSLSYCVENIFSLSREGNYDQAFNSKGIHIDLEDETTIADAASAIRKTVHELDVVCVGLHPGTVDTSLSKPYQRGVEPGKLFSTTKSAKYLLQVLDSLSPNNSGFIYSWDGVELPY